MSKFAIVLTEESKAIATENGVPHSTVYARLKRGWDLEKAVTEKPRAFSYYGRDEHGSNIGKGLGKSRSIRFDQELDEAIDAAIAESGKTQSEFLADLVLPALMKKLKIK